MMQVTQTESTDYKRLCCGCCAGRTLHQNHNYRIAVDQCICETHQSRLYGLRARTCSHHRPDRSFQVLIGNAVHDQPLVEGAWYCGIDYDYYGLDQHRFGVIAQYENGQFYNEDGEVEEAMYAYDIFAKQA